MALDLIFTTTDIDDTRGDGCAGKHKIEGSPPGWVYAISDNGDEGWIQYYNVQRVSRTWSPSLKNMYLKV